LENVARKVIVTIATLCIFVTLLASCSSPSFKIIDSNERTLRDYIMIYSADTNDSLFVILIDRDANNLCVDCTRCDSLQKNRFYRFDIISVPDTQQLFISDAEKVHFRGHIREEYDGERGLNELYEYKGKFINIYNGYDQLMVKGYFCPSLRYRDGLIYHCNHNEDSIENPSDR